MRVLHVIWDKCMLRWPEIIGAGFLPKLWLSIAVLWLLQSRPAKLNGRE